MTPPPGPDDERAEGQSPGGLWRFHARIPVDLRFGLELSLGEGDTPLIPVDDGELAGVRCKLEYVSPTGSFKDRGAVVLLASLRERGARQLIADSSGNAGTAIAAYATRAGLPCRVFVPAGTSAAKQASIRAFGASLEVVDGDRTAAAAAAQAAVRAGGGAYASHVHDPAFRHGTKTFAFEVWEQMGDVPDAIVVPTGNGTLLLGIWMGFTELHGAGLISRRPALVAVQAERCAPLVRAWEGRGGAAGARTGASGARTGASGARTGASGARTGAAGARTGAAGARTGASSPAGVPAGPTVAEGIAVPHPAREAEMLAAVEASGGCAVAVPERAIAPAQIDLARRGLLVEPTAAVPWAVVLAVRRGSLPAGRGSLPAGRASLPGPEWSEAARLLAGTVVVPLCGSGIKSGLIGA